MLEHRKPLNTQSGWSAPPLFGRTRAFGRVTGVVGPLHRHKVAQEIRKEVSVLEREAHGANRVNAAWCQGMAAGLRKAVALLMTPGYAPFERLEPWEIARRLQEEADALHARSRSANRLDAQRLHGQIAGMRKGAEMLSVRH